MKKIFLLAGARPNYMKIFPIWKEINAGWPEAKTSIIHTGQHYDPVMSDVFFDDFSMPKPDFFLGIGSGTHGLQTGRALEKIEKVLLADLPDLLLVVGDVNSTVAGAMAAVKLGIPCAHVEAGLRSFDRTMPEEVNRVLTDAIVDILLTPSSDGNDNLLKEGISKDKIFLVGNVMIDSLVEMLPKRKPPPFPLPEKDFIVTTLHRPSNVDDPDKLKKILASLNNISSGYPVIFPMHPRTRKVMDALSPPITLCSQFRLCEPLSYLEFLRLTSSATLIITDSGGIQEESSYLGIPCLTVRPNTERPITIEQGTNRLVNLDVEPLEDAIHEAIAKRPKEAPKIPLWDGNAAQRIVQMLRDSFV